MIACLMKLVDRYESIACGEITGIRKQVVAVYFQRLCRSSPGEAEKNNQKLVKTICSGRVPQVCRSGGRIPLSAIAPSILVEIYCCGEKNMIDTYSTALFSEKSVNL